VNNDELTQKKRRTIWMLSFLVLGMFGFGFALVPLYDLFCQVTGIQSVNVRTAAGNSGRYVANPSPINESRFITIKFDTSVHPNLPWDVSPLVPNMRVNPGKQYQVNFSARNRSSSEVIGQAIPSVVPWQATGFLNKLECFCFNQQTLAGGESVEMPLRFIISPDLPVEIQSLTLSYSLMKLENQSSAVQEKAEG